MIQERFLYQREVALRRLYVLGRMVLREGGTALSQEKRHRANRPSGEKNAIPVANYPMPDFYWQL